MIGLHHVACSRHACFPASELKAGCELNDETVRYRKYLIFTLLFLYVCGWLGVDFSVRLVIHLVSEWTLVMKVKLQCSDLT